MKKILYVFLVVTLLSGLVLSVSCTCTKKEMPYGEVLWWRANISETDFKTERNTKVDRQTATDLYKEGTSKVYVLVNLPVEVVNKGAHGILTFHAACHLDTLSNKNQDSVNITLGNNQEGNIAFAFWVNVADVPAHPSTEWSKEAFTIQALNLFIED
ncbi:hypothetical protein ACFLYR_07920 [Chloroflexota bacterium]